MRPAAAILAGGRARRLGGARKHALVVGGARIIDRQLPILRQVADPVFIVASDAAPYRDLDVDVVPDIVPDRGSLGGIYTAVMTSPRERTLVVACDMPFLSLPLLQRLSSTMDADIVIPRTTRGYEPLCAVYAKSCSDAFRTRIDAGQLQASLLPEGLRVQEIGPEALASYDPDGLLFVNVNTPHDYERALGLYNSRRESPEDRITDKP